MGKHRYPPLTPSETVTIVEALGFCFKRQTGSHAFYEKPASGNRQRAVVCIDMAKDVFWPEIIKSMIEQSKHTRVEFYGATKKSAKKI